MDSNRINITTAFELLLEQLGLEIEKVNREGARAFEASEYERVDTAKDQGKRLADFRDRIASLSREWQTFPAARRSRQFVDASRTKFSKRRPRRDFGRMSRGEVTQAENYFRPILMALVEMGGSGKANSIIVRVGRIMKDELNSVDCQPTTSNPARLRWHNTAYGTRKTLVRRGLLKAGSKHGIWEISDAGRRFLTERDR